MQRYNRSMFNKSNFQYVLLRPLIVTYQAPATKVDISTSCHFQYSPISFGFYFCTPH